jgi:hypothetical protein
VELLVAVPCFIVKQNFHNNCCGSAWAGLRHGRLADISQLRWSLALLQRCPIKPKPNLKYQIDKP